MRIFLVSILIAALSCAPMSALDDHPHVITLDNRAPLTNRDVVTMVKAKFSDDVIVKTIQANRTDFDVSVPALLRLQNAGVSQHIIDAMLSTGKRHTGTAPTAMQTSVEDSSKTENSSIEPPAQAVASTVVVPAEVGVFLMQHQKLVAIEPEIVNWRSGGVLKTTATLGLDKGHVNGTVPGSHSGLIVSWPHEGGPLEFYVRCPEGSSASEYQLLRLWDKGNRREFRAVTGGILHRSGGAQMNAVHFQYEKVAPRTYKIPFASLEPGEYGFLAPGGIESSNAASLGKIYTFRVPD